MPDKKKLIGAAAFSAAIVGGGAAGAVFGTPSLSFAQNDEDTTTTTTEDTTTTGDDKQPGPRFDHGPGPFADLEVAAEAIGITTDELRQALEDGSTIAEVAEANEVDTQTVIDALVAAATERLEEIEAELPDRISEMVEEEFEFRGPGGHGFRFGFAIGGNFDAAAEALGLTTDELHEAVRGGSTLAEIAEENGVDVQAVIDALVADATERIDAAVADGDLEADRAEEMKTNLTERVTDLVNGELPDFERGPGRHRGGPFGPFGGAEEDADEES